MSVGLVRELPVVPVETFGVMEGSEEIDVLELLGVVEVLPVFDPSFPGGVDVCGGCYNASSVATSSETSKAEIHTSPPTAWATEVAT